MSADQEKKEKKWLFFAIGLLAGFAISVLSFVVFSMIQNKSKSFTQTIEHIYRPENTKDTVVKYVNIVRNETKEQVVKENVGQSDSLMLDEIGENLDEVDFSYNAEEVGVNDDVVVEDRMIAQKKVKIRYKDSDFKDIASSEGAVDFFEVQQWNTPIKNRISYHFSDNILQIKGLEIDRMEVVFFEQQYYLGYHGNYYLIENNKSFEKLGAPLVMNPQR